MPTAADGEHPGPPQLSCGHANHGCRSQIMSGTFHRFDCNYDTETTWFLAFRHFTLFDFVGFDLSFRLTQDATYEYITSTHCMTTYRFTPLAGRSEYVLKIGLHDPSSTNTAAIRSAAWRSCNVIPSSSVLASAVHAHLPLHPTRTPVAPPCHHNR